MPGCFEATPEQAALALDGLADFRVVLVATSGFTDPPRAWLSLVKDGARRTCCPPASATSSWPRRSRGSR